ncbi:hypothetical protein VTL71DRAFT_9948 [Oculimacula yallundae]|uniref:Uncharacterized protein n=1 Tax=Oculimacula yallundae TaxID=86028 RepID=A0ABR4BSD6_9HELO
MTSAFESPQKSFDGDMSDDRLLQEPSDDCQPDHVWRSKIGPRTKICVGVTAIALIAIILIQASAITTLLQHQINTRDISRKKTSISTGNILHCGRSPEQAKALDCAFDIMDYSWTPRPCFHSSLSQHYLNLTLAQNLSFYLDSSHLQTLPISEILAGKHEYAFTTRIFHTTHCEYYLHRQTQVLMNGLGTSLMRNSSYGLHCLDEVMRPGDKEEGMFTGFHYERCALGLGYLDPSERRRPKGKLGKIVDGGAGNDLVLPP